VTIAIHDARGARVAMLLNDDKPAGAHTLRWEGPSDGGDVVSSGVYFAKIAFAGEKRAYKLVLLK
jgi:flagellar hook assembly protein FlgD